MPTYEYECKGCGRAFEAVQAFSDDPLTTCEICGGRLRKIYGAVGIVFKGSGFYKTDSRPSGNGAKQKDAESTGTTGGEKPSTKETTSGAPATSSSSEPSTPAPPAKSKDTVGTK